VNVRITSQKLCAIAVGIMIMLGPSVQLLRSEAHRANPAASSNVRPPNPFHIFSSCPPAVCIGQWDGMADPATGSTDFTPAGIREQFSFATWSPVTWYCDDQTEHCHADYNSGTFTATGPAGTFTGVITSGSADQAPLASEIWVSFTGQWSNGQRMTGTANERYRDELQIPDTTLIMTPAQ
jgi:hypothetical protein